MAAALFRGLTLSDLDRMTIGQLVDYIVEWNNISDPDKSSSKEEEASQNDIDNFLTYL